MVSESHPPEPPSGGGLKYGIIGLLLLAGAIGLWFVVRGGPEPPKKPVATTKIEEPNRSTALSHQEIVIPKAEPDAGTVAPPTHRRRARRSGACEGEIDPNQAMAVINENRRQVRQCYERRLKVNNILQGSMNMQLRIGSTGNVESVSIGGTLRDNEVYSCVRRLAESWKFPAPKKGRCAVIAAPFDFTPKTP